eukprot:TCONS_00061786-protein
MSSNFIDLTSELEASFSINIWRKEINPFVRFGFLKDSKFEKPFDDLPSDSERSGTIQESNPDVQNEQSPKKDDTNIDEEEEFSIRSNNQSYHVEFFNLILQKIKNQPDVFDVCFNDTEKNTFRAFKELSPDCQELYVRLFQRKHTWIKEEKIKYDNINHPSCLKSLTNEGFLQNETSLKKLDEIINLLSLAEARSLIADFKMGKNNLSKSEIKETLQKNCKKQKTLFGSMEDIVIKKAKKMLGKCVLIEQSHSAIFSRMLTLFQMFISLFASDNNNILYHLLQVKIKQIIYTKYEVCNNSYLKSIFQSRESFTYYAEAVNLSDEFNILVESNLFEDAFVLYTKAFKKLKDSNIHCREDLPGHLKRYTAYYIFLRICRSSVTVLEKLKKYKEAVELVDFVLASPLIHAKHRGELWERKIIDCERHLKNLELAHLSIEEAIKDPMVRGHWQYVFKQRLSRMEKKSKKKKGTDDNMFELENYKKVPIELLKATALLDTSSAHRAVFMSPSSSGGNIMSNVENLVLETYKAKGFVGLHHEGSTLMTLYVLLFWDIIFMNVDGVFLSEYQNAPLDMFTDDFYVKRKDDLDERLHFVYTATKQEIAEKLTKSWNENYQSNVACCNWSIFPSVQKAIDLTVCLKPKVLGGICEVYAKDLRSRMSGFPDLILWNLQTKSCKIIEVKGPGDKLSSKQIVWLDILQFLGADVSVCHVTGIGSKRKFVATQEV